MDAPKERETVLDGVSVLVIRGVAVPTTEAERAQLNVPDGDGDMPRVDEARVEKLALADTEIVDDTKLVTVGFCPVADVLELPVTDDETEIELL